MSISVRDVSGLNEIGEVWIRDALGLSQIAEIWLRDASGLSQIFGAFSLVSSGDSTGSTSSHGSLRVSTNTVTVTPKPSGSVTSVLWTIDDGTWDILSPTSLSTGFRSPPLGPGDSSVATATCTVTRGSQTAHVDVGVTAYNVGF